MDNFTVSTSADESVPMMNSLIDTFVIPDSDHLLFADSDLSSELSELLSIAKRPGALVGKHFFTNPRTYPELAERYPVSPATVRDGIKKDTQRIIVALDEQRFHPIRQIVRLIRHEFQAAVPVNSKSVERWRVELGGMGFEFLKYLAGYFYKEDWLIRHHSSLLEAEKSVLEAINGEWLINIEQLGVSTVHPDTLDHILGDKWKDIGEGWHIKWDDSLSKKAKRVLHLVGKPMTPSELTEKMGEGKDSQIRNTYRPDMVRTTKEFHLSLPEWGRKEYKGISAEILERIETGGGVASRKAMVQEFAENFLISKNSVYAYLRAGPYLLSGDEVRLDENTEYVPKDVSSYEYAVRVSAHWGQRTKVEAKHLKGYSFKLDTDIAAHNGVRPDDSHIVPVLHNGSQVGSASVRWNRHQVVMKTYIGQMRTVLEALGISDGDEFILVATPHSCEVILEV